jgi:hypothetical protein
VPGQPLHPMSVAATGPFGRRCHAEEGLPGNGRARP